MINRNLRSAFATSRPRAAPSKDWLLPALSSFGRRRFVAAQRPLFAEGDLATDYYFVLSGQLLVHRRSISNDGVRQRPLIRFLQPGDLFCYVDNDARMADCEVIVDSALLLIDRRRFIRLAEFDPELMRLAEFLDVNEHEFLAQL